MISPEEAIEIHAILIRRFSCQLELGLRIFNYNPLSLFVTIKLI